MNVLFLKRYALCAALPLLLGGCATMAPPAGVKPGVEAAAPRPYADRLDLGGRLSIRYENHGRDEAMHGSFVWSQNPSHTNVTLLSPLGQTIAVIDMTPDGASLTQGGQQVRTAANVDTLVTQTLGWPLPVSGLRHWLQGFAVDASGKRFIANPQATEVATRDGWQIHYAAWEDDAAENGAAQARPRRIDLKRSTAQAGDVSIRIVIDNWQTPQQ
jgi:outer membrane lipoprotein LolB